MIFGVIFVLELDFFFFSDPGEGAVHDAGLYPGVCAVAKLYCDNYLNSNRKINVCQILNIDMPDCVRNDIQNALSVVEEMYIGCDGNHDLWCIAGWLVSFLLEKHYFYCIFLLLLHILLIYLIYCT